MEIQNTHATPSQDQSKSNQRLANSDLRSVSLQLDPIKRNYLLARVDDQTQTFTAALVNPGAAASETDGSGTFSHSDAPVFTATDSSTSPQNKEV